MSMRFEKYLTSITLEEQHKACVSMGENIADLRYFVEIQRAHLIVDRRLCSSLSEKKACRELTHVADTILQNKTSNKTLISLQELCMLLIYKS